MAEAETVRTITASKAQGMGVLVPGIGTRQEVAKRAAETWADLAALGAEYGVPEGHWQVDDDAMELLGPEPEQAPGGSA